ncbi:ATP-binding protein [Fundidesulfovibrio putealis]|uniref:ATP-binding protein n=1 Tax=Fundidesulfovibrio putealis TaxID=270496 RepID=UPI0005BE20EE|nr:ATP-binding protein [Fundidesulfovibrio putealis]
MPSLRSGFSPRRSFVLQHSPWLIVGGAIILGVAIAVLAARNTQREKRHMSQNLVDRADALIWAVEAGTRTWMGFQGGSRQLQALVEETAKQPGIAYLAVVDGKGRILAHNDPTRIGALIHEGEDVARLGASEQSAWRINESAAEKIFEVYKIFAPAQEYQHGMHGMGHSSWGDCPDCGVGGMGRQGSAMPFARTNGNTLVFVGLDIKPFEEALAEDFRNTMVIAMLVAFLGLGGFVSLFWAQNYRLSRRQLQDTRAFASEVVTSLPVGLLTSDTDGKIKLANAAASAMLGIERGNLLGMPLRGLGSLEWEPIIAALAGDEAVLEREVELAASRGRKAPVSLSASRIVNEEGLFLGHLFILRDLGEVRRLQEQVRRNERLTALGNLAAGVAHEIRNPLSSIKGFATYLASKIKGEGPDKDAAKMMIQEVDRLNRVVSELLEFARPGEMKLKVEDINQVIERTLRLASSDASAKGIATRFSRNDSLTQIPIDSERLTQALLNLFLNAVQAMDPGGVLEVSTSIESASGRVSVRIADTGKGMAPEVLSDIFNPYFTSKPSGTGLGLAIVHRIVEGHGGEIKVESQPGKGTVFTILLPLARMA